MMQAILHISDRFFELEQPISHKDYPLPKDDRVIDTKASLEKFIELLIFAQELLKDTIHTPTIRNIRFEQPVIGNAHRLAYTPIQPVVEVRGMSGYGNNYYYERKLYDLSQKVWKTNMWVVYKEQDHET